MLNRGTFTNSGAGQIIINQFSEDGIYNLAPNSSSTNSASINIGSASAGVNGIRNASNSTFINQATGVIAINRTAQNGLWNSTGATFEHFGQMNIGLPGTNGIQNASSFTNRPTGSINVEQATDNSLLNTLNSSFFNEGVTTLGAPINAAGYGLRNDAY